MGPTGKIMECRFYCRKMMILAGSLMVMAAVYLTRKSDQTTHHRIMMMPAAGRNNHNNEMMTESCDIFSGKWVYDDISYPLYKEKECSFMLDEFSCEKFGRKDTMYQHWRWKPHQCHLPRFNAREFLRKLRGKRMVFVGDSLSRNQWVSLVCLVESSLDHLHISSHVNGSMYTFKSTEYNVSIEFYWAPFLVESNCDDPINHRVENRIVRAHAIEKHAKYWTDADIVIFDSYIWWLDHSIKIMWGSFEDNPDERRYKEMNLLSRYKMGLNTWSDWIEKHVNLTKTQLFFISMSPSHLRASEWGMEEGNNNCYNETKPILGKEGYWGSLSNAKMMRIVEGEIEKLRSKSVKIKLLNVTQLSEYRKDGHPSIYRRQWEPASKLDRSNPPSYADCGHWCLPGVPDVWNELLYAYIIMQSS
ncbi:protein trichome birefringence-like 34 [Impatiens glandulifera]|uniref:protein trichome birefringence-like 34 n=1 Tax=Impatiens glandulifera TaxID=253017 RepID=UPI001FB07D51|nr:protein trichome birefringence-like 34 [Impatiens glandulifera]